MSIDDSRRPRSPDDGLAFRWLLAGGGPRRVAVAVLPLALGAGGLVAAALDRFIAHEIGRGVWGALALAAAVAAAAAVCWAAQRSRWVRRRVGLAAGELRVAADGRGAWLADGATGPVPARLRRWLVAGPVVWLRLQAGPGSPVDLLMVRQPGLADEWRRLRAWLAWHERGGGRS